MSDEINRSCLCKTLDRSMLAAQLKEAYGIEDRPHLFSSTIVYVSQTQYRNIETTIREIERVIHSHSFQEVVLANAPAVSRLNPGASGVFMGYDFHFEGEQPKLIEINTNAGGALLNVKLARAQNACCEGVASVPDLESTFHEMFLQEWRLEKGAAPLKTIAIVDEKPEEQYLYPEFLLFQKLFERFGIKALIAAPGDLSWSGGKLRYREEQIDLVYNRLTDFYLELPDSQSVRAAYESGEVVVTPNPRHHALYANKTNLTILSQGEELKKLGVDLESRKVLLSGIPETVKLEPSQTDEFWAKRKQYFFKPAAGYGSKAAYRGDKITTKVWSEILNGNYVAQRIVSPSERLVEVDHGPTDLKVDFRAYVYRGKIQLLASRLYSGQTTNFRTQGGGFAPVVLTESN